MIGRPPGRWDGFGKVAIVLLIVAELVPTLGTLSTLIWVVGLVLLFFPTSWSTPLKLQGFFVLGLGHPVMIFLTLASANVRDTGGAGLLWSLVGFVVAFLVVQCWVAIKMYRMLGSD